MRSLIIQVLLMMLAGTARAELVHYLGPHPLALGAYRGMCFIEGPHLHDYAPQRPLLYIRVGEGWSFIGDPTEYETETPRYAYYGHHPVFWARGEAGAAPVAHVCYINGPHHHWYAPPPELGFQSKGGVYWYIGAMPPGYVRRWHRHSPIDDHYATAAFLVPRPVVTVAPPAGFVGFYIGPGYHRVYHVGPPSVNVIIGGGVWMHGHGHGYYGHGYWGGHGWGHAEDD